MNTVACEHCGTTESEIADSLQYGMACQPCVDAGAGTTSSLIDFTEIVAKPVRWAWPNRIALAKLTALAGRPKIGKGLLYSHLIARVTRGELRGDLKGPRNVILVTTEDEPGDTLKPRLMAAGADLSRVAIFQMGSRDEPVPFRVPRDAEAPRAPRSAEAGRARRDRPADGVHRRQGRHHG